MTLAVLAKTIHGLSEGERNRLFDRLKVDLEDYLLTKISIDRFTKASKKRIDWQTLKA